MRFRGIGLTGRVIKFSIVDCPVVVKQGELALFDGVCSEIIRLNTVTRGEGELFEGDRVCDISTGQLLGYVQYCKGFCLQDISGKLKELPTNGHIKIVEGDRESIRKVTEHNGFQPLNLVYGKKEVELNAVVTKVGASIAFAGEQKLIPQQDVFISTGYYEPRIGRSLGFGEAYKGGAIVIHDMRVCVDYGKEYIGIEEVFRRTKRI